jgi:hypothetical protein
VVGLLHVQEFEPRISYFRARVMQLEKQLTAKRGRDKDLIPTGILQDVSSAKAVKRSVKALRVTAARAFLLEAGTGAELATSRLREASALKAAERCRALRGVTEAGRIGSDFVNLDQAFTQEQFTRDLYCVGIGLTTEHCLLPQGGFRLSMPGPYVPSMTSADKRMGHPRGALHFLLRLNRPAFQSSAFTPPRRAGWRDVPGLYPKLVRTQCPICANLPTMAGEGKYARESSPMHLMLSCKHERLRPLQIQLRKEAADVLERACSALVREMKPSLKKEPEKAELDKCKADITRLCKAGALDVDSVDANNVIYRMMALVPFPEQLSAAGEGSEGPFPLIQAFGRLFDRVEADRPVMGAAATRIISWTEGQIQKFAAARLEILGIGYFQERVGGGDAVYEDTESEDASVGDLEESADGGVIVEGP